MTKYRTFELKEDITQGEYVTFRAGLEESRPPAWNSIETLPIEVFYHVLTVAAVKAGWVMDVVELNEYEEETTWEWNEEYVLGLKASGKSPITGWGNLVFDRWMEIKTLDPN
jgi:hypothetical protein